ncbi:cadmium-translocating P-type ATPase [Sedimentibacter sp. zth1]|uniref:heavy metal translocating P-type ATPase n=1 Tax=Sedimentibacter sp. zth1 TaxID=2816908 RepID=UPI001A9254A6|nr:heavy metal translocating P-type ATPase [Sedimentibacter sp. zth1]QSX05419.1 cadmium-translocating P-type ATPase [Sedimentibacter sp. zth1]
MKELIINLDGLNCAHCASKIEALANKHENVENAFLNFVNKKITVEYSNVSEDNIFNDIEKIVHKLEPDVQVSKDDNIDTECSCVCECDCACDNHSTEVVNPIKKVNKELVRIIVATILFLPAVFLESNKMLSMVLLISSYIIIGYDIVIRAFKNLISGQIFDENFLMAIASLGAIFIGEYPEAAGVMLFYRVGEYFQDIAVNKSRNQIKSLLNIKPEFANLKMGDSIRKVKPDLVKINDIIIVKPGEKIPLDGIITEGASSIDTSALTGESMPIDKITGDEVLSGSINQTGVLTMSVTKTFKESTVSKILYLVEKASNKKSQTENFITKFAKYYTPIVVFVAALIAIIPPIVLKQPLYDWLYIGLTFLVVSCPCALVLSIPLTYFSGLGTSSKYGILVKGGNYLEALSKAEIAVFDKTGTLTEGKFNVSEIKATNGFNENDLLKIAAYGEYYSNHPIAKSIKEKYSDNILRQNISNYKEIAGYGVSADIDNKATLLGNEKLMIKNNIKYEQAKDKPGTVLYVSHDNVYVGYIVISDKIKEDAKDLVKNLKLAGIKKTIMLTGDNKITANYVKEQIGLDEVYSDLLPTNKVDIVEDLFKNKHPKAKLLFVGDGINDAPVLTRADIGFAMGGMGSDAAIESADVVIMNDEPSKVIQSIEIAKKTKSIVWQNIIFCLGVKLLVMIFTVYGNVKMPLAVFADVGVAILAVLNASRLLKIKFK